MAAQGSLPRGPSEYSILPHPLQVCAQPHVASCKNGMNVSIKFLKV